MFADDSFQAFDHDMARCSLFVWQPVSFMLGVPQKANGLSLQQTIPFDSVFGNRTGVRNLFRKQSRFAENGRGCYIGGRAVYAASRSYQATMPPSRFCRLIGPADMRRKSAEMTLLPVPWRGRWVW